MCGSIWSPPADLGQARRQNDVRVGTRTSRGLVGALPQRQRPRRPAPAHDRGGQPGQRLPRAASAWRGPHASRAVASGASAPAAAGRGPWPSLRWRHGATGLTSRPGDRAGGTGGDPRGIGSGGASPWS